MLKRSTDEIKGGLTKIGANIKGYTSYSVSALPANFKKAASAMEVSAF